MPTSVTPTFQICYVAVPSDTHPDVATHGEASIACWIVGPTIKDADKIASAYVKRHHWVIVQREYADVATRGDYEETEQADLLAFYDQAQIDREVYVFHNSPRFGLFRVVAAVCRTLDDGAREDGEAHYLLLNETVAEEDEDVYSLSFWTPPRVATALSRTREIVEDEGWTIESILHSDPVDWVTADDELRGFCEQAEADGECLVFVIDL